MRKTGLIIIALWLTISAFAEQKDSTIFRAYLYNNEYDVYLNINFYDENIKVPGQELYGPLPGYLGKKNNSFCWVITSAKIAGKTATISLINDYGSEDLTATLAQKNDSIYILKQESGSTLKVPKNGKWQKLPKTLELKRRK
jgi:hypothetical protein